MAPGRADPTGTVSFLVDGQQVGTAPVSGGRAELAYTAAPGAERSVAAIYSGDTELTGSRSDVRRGDPTISALVVSNAKRSAYGWYRARPTVSFTCSAGAARLVGPCPEPISVTSEGTTRVARTIATSDGGSATVSVSVSLDESDPVAKVRGVGRIGGSAPRCVGSNDVSGVAVCRLRRTNVAGGLVKYIAVVRDRAGNTARAVRVVHRR